MGTPSGTPSILDSVFLTHPHDFFRFKNLEVVPSTCFVLMPFAQQFTMVYESVNFALRGLMVCTRADDITTGNILERILRGIASSGRNPNVFYELGIAHTRTKDVLLLTQSIEDVPFDLREILRRSDANSSFVPLSDPISCFSTIECYSKVIRPALNGVSGGQWCSTTGELSLRASVFSIDCLSLSVTIRCRRTERTVPAPAIYERPRSERLKWRRIPLRSTSYPLNEVTLFSDRPPARCGYRKFGARYRVGIGDGGLISCPVLRNYAVVQRPYTPGSFLHSYFTAACFPRRVTARYGLRRPPIIPRTTDARSIKSSNTAGAVGAPS